MFLGFSTRRSLKKVIKIRKYFLEKKKNLKKIHDFNSTVFTTFSKKQDFLTEAPKKIFIDFWSECPRTKMTIFRKNPFFLKMIFDLKAIKKVFIIKKINKLMVFCQEALNFFHVHKYSLESSIKNFLKKEKII